VLEDPELALKVRAAVSKTGIGSVGLAGDKLTVIGDRGLVVMAPDGRLIVIAPDSEFAPLLTAARSNPEAYKLYYVLTRAGLSTDDLLYSDLPRIFHQIKQGQLSQAAFKSLRFEVRGNRLYVMPAEGKPHVLAEIDLSAFSPEEFMSLVIAGDKFMKAFGRAYHNFVVDTVAFGHGLLSPQTVNLDFLLALPDAPEAPIINLGEVLPRVKNAVGFYTTTGKAQLYLSYQVLEKDVKRADGH
jgi:hypothetical protein